jgi:hypothetical protein
MTMIIKNNKGRKVLTEKTIPTCDSCCKNPPEEEHTCPFAEEIHGNEELCNCCSSCEKQCAMDI